MLPLLGLVPGVRPHQIGLVLFDAHLVDAGHGAPEALEIVHLAGVALHPDHLDHHLHAGAALLFQAGETDEVVAHFFEACAFAVELEALLGGAVETQRDVLQRRGEQPLGHLLIEERAVGREQSRGIMALAIFDALEDLGIHERLAQADEHHVLRGGAGFLHQPLEDFVGHVLFGLLVRFARTHRAVEIALGRGLDDVLHR